MGVMTTIYLVRHTNYENPDNICAGRLPFPLSELGREEALNLQKYFANKQIEKIYSSAVERCKETAMIIANQQIEIDYDSRLLETLSAGQGRPGNNGQNYFGHRLSLGGESNKTIQERMVDFFEHTAWQEGRNYIICSHGDPLYFLYQYLKNEPLITDIEIGQPIPKYPNYQEKGSVLPITMENGQWNVGKVINQTELNI